MSHLIWNNEQARIVPLQCSEVEVGTEKLFGPLMIQKSFLTRKSASGGVLGAETARTPASNDSLS